MNDATPQELQNSNDEISWTQDELKKWCEAELVPTDLLEPIKLIELHNFLRANKKILHANYRRNTEDDHYQITLPPASEWDKSPDLEVVDRRTGKVVSVLEMGTDYMLCEGILLKVKVKELKDWGKETAGARSLNKKQNETLKASLERLGQRPLSRKEIVTLIEEIRKPKKTKTFRQSKELIDNKLDHKQEDQLTIFDYLDKAKNQELQEKPFIKGLDLDQAEDRIVHTLTLLLSRKSENKNQKSADYYMGNHGKGMVSVFDTDMETARIIITPHELYSTYYGKENYGSDQISFLLKKLESLSKKLFLTTWNIQAKSKGKEKRYDKFRTYLPLFQIAILNQDLSESESQVIDNNKSLLEGKNCHFLFKFQPQFTNNIRERYVEFPEDIHLRIAEATGKDRYGQCVNLMRDFLFREKQVKRYDPIRDKLTLISTLKLDKFWKEGRKKKVNEMIKECFEIFLKIGLITGLEELQGKLGQEQYRMLINKEFK